MQTCNIKNTEKSQKQTLANKMILNLEKLQSLVENPKELHEETASSKHLRRNFMQKQSFFFLSFWNKKINLSFSASLELFSQVMNASDAAP